MGVKCIESSVKNTSLWNIPPLLKLMKKTKTYWYTDYSWWWFPLPCGTTFINQHIGLINVKLSVHLARFEWLCLESFHLPVPAVQQWTILMKEIMLLTGQCIIQTVGSAGSRPHNVCLHASWTPGGMFCVKWGTEKDDKHYMCRGCYSFFGLNPFLCQN